MIEFNGKSVCKALAMGKLHFMSIDSDPIKRTRITDVKSEIKRFSDARTEVSSQLSRLYQTALEQVGEVNAQIFQIHLMMLDDEDYHGAITAMIQNQQVNAEYAVSYTSDLFIKTFENTGDEYMKARASDVQDISGRLLTTLTGKTALKTQLTEPVIIVADDLTPSETLQLDKDKILGFVTFGGSTSSHTAILARSMDIPALIGTGSITSDFDGKTAILDGITGTLTICPNHDCIAQSNKVRKGN